MININSSTLNASFLGTGFSPQGFIAIFSALGLLVTIVTLISKIYSSKERRKQREFEKEEANKFRRFEIIEQSFDVLQRLNEKAASSRETALAAVHSSSPNDKMTGKQAQMLYFQYMRINRIFRAYEYHRGDFISDEELERIIKSQIQLLLPARGRIKEMLERGYPEDFRRFMIKSFKNIKPVSKINGENL